MTIDADLTPPHGIERPHLSNVRPLFAPVKVNPRHPSLYNRDDETPAEPAGVTLTPIEARIVAGLLRSLRNHAPSHRAIDAAIELLDGPKGAA